MNIARVRSFLKIEFLAITLVAAIINFVFTRMVKQWENPLAAIALGEYWATIWLIFGILLFVITLLPSTHSERTLAGFFSRISGGSMLGAVVAIVLP